MTVDLSCPTPGAAARRPGLAGAALAIAGVGGLAALTITGQFRADQATGLLGLDIAAGALSCVLVPVLLRWPVAGAVALAALATVSPAATPGATAAALVVAQRERFAVAAGVAATGLAAHAAQGLWRPLGGLSLVWWLALVTIGYAALLGWGTLIRARWALVASLCERALRAEAEQGRRVAQARAAERARIAREMHDVLAHRLSLVATYAGALEYRPDSSPEQLSQAAGVVRAGVREALTELREVISVLRDDDSVGDGESGQRPQPALADIPRLVAEARNAGQRVALDDRVVDATTAPPVAGRAAYRVAQEGLTNARKHAAGQPVRVLLDGKPGAALVVDVSNPLADATSDDPTRSGLPGGGSGSGLIGLTERVRLAGGQLDHEVTAAGEFHLRARLPWPR